MRVEGVRVERSVSREEVRVAKKCEQSLSARGEGVRVEKECE